MVSRSRICQPAPTAAREALQVLPAPSQENGMFSELNPDTWQTISSAHSRLEGREMPSRFSCDDLYCRGTGEVHVSIQWPMNAFQRISDSYSHS